MTPRSLPLLILLLLASAPALAQPQPGKDAAKPSGGEEKGESVSFTIENSLSIRDPFRRTLSQGQNALDESLPELIRFDIDKFKLVGVITGPKKAKALLTGPSGKMHIVAEDTAIGTRHGRIKHITPGAIEIEEKVINLLGQEENIETMIEIKEEKKREEPVQPR